MVMIRFLSRLQDKVESATSNALLGLATGILYLTMSVFLRGFLSRPLARMFVRLAGKAQGLSSRLMLRQIKRIRRRCQSRGSDIAA